MPFSSPGAIVPAASEGGSDMDALLSFVRRLSRARSQPEVMAIVSQGVRRLLRADGATFVLRDGDRCYYAEEDAISPLWKGRRFPLTACISGWCMMNARTVAIPDIYQDVRVPADAYRPTFVRSLAMAPVGPGDPIAALGAYWSELHQASAEEIEHLQALADAASLAMVSVQPQVGEDAGLRRAATEPARDAEAPTPRHGALRASVERSCREALRGEPVNAYGFAFACVTVATLVRIGFQASGAHGLAVYSVYYPAVLLAMLVGGKRSGVAAAALGALAGAAFLPPLYGIGAVDVRNLLKLAFYGLTCGLIVLIIDWHQRAVLRLKQEDAGHLTLAREQQHRARNAVVLVETVVRQSLPADPAQARIINQRIRAAFADVDVHLVSRPVRVAALLADELDPFDAARFSFEGDAAIRLAPEAARLVSLAAHELATNAMKHGALSTPDGRVAVAWRSLDGRLTLNWRESGGPPVRPPQRRGYGSVMLRRMVEAAGGALDIAFRPSGVIAEISLPLKLARRG